MAKKRPASKKNTASGVSTQSAIAARKQEQQRKNRRTKLIVSGVIVAVIIVVIALVVALVHVQQQKAEKAQDTQGAALSVSEQVGKDRGFTIGAKGAGSVNKGKSVVDVYLDYSCSHCADLEHQYGRELIQGALDGHYTLRYRPVLTQSFPLAFSGADAAIRTYQEQPEKFIEVHTQLMEAAYDALMAYSASNEDQAKLAPMQEDAVQTARRVARQAGVEQKIVDHIGVQAAQKPLSEWTRTLSKSRVVGGESWGTPLVAIDDKKVAGNSLAEIVQQVTKLR